MPKLILPSSDLRRIIRQRRRTGADRLDEVWDGVYVMSPEPDNRHQKLAGRLFSLLDAALLEMQADVYPAINVSDRKEGWRRNYRVPDASVFLPGNPAEDCGSHWYGGPDFAVEILSPGDRSRKKFPFYAKVGVRELLLVDRRPWCLELYRREGQEWHLVGKSLPPESATLASTVLPLSFRLLPGEPRPLIEVTRPADGTRWLA